MINEGVRRAYLHPDNKLRASIVADPNFTRKNTRDNTPAVIHTQLVPGDELEITVAAKGGGSENKSKFVMLNPSDSLVDWVLKTVPLMGAGWCPPGMLGIGIGGSAEKAMLLAKEALMEPIDMTELKARGPQTKTEELRIELYDKVNALGIGAQGLGGLSTVLDVKIFEYPTHAASKPVAMIPNCAATRHVHFTLDGSGPAELEPPKLSDWPKIDWAPAADARRVNLDTLTPRRSRELEAGRAAAAQRQACSPAATPRTSASPTCSRRAKRCRPASISAIASSTTSGPVDPVRDEVVGPAGPTTATRMDKFTEMMLEKTGLIAMVGKAERGPAGIEAIRKHRAAYLMAVGGAAYLVSKAIKASRVWRSRISAWRPSTNSPWRTCR